MASCPSQDQRASKKGCSSSFPRRFLLLDSGLNSVRNVLSAGAKQPDEGKQAVFETLQEIGLLNFMGTVFKWQKAEICSEFVLHWCQDKSKTYVNDVEIDLSLAAVCDATGLLAEDTAMDSEDANDGGRYDACAQMAQLIRKRDDTKNRWYLGEFEDPSVQDLLLLLTTTLWMKCSLPRRVPTDLIESLCEAFSGKRLLWGNILHRKFINEIRRLQSLSQTLDKHCSDGSVKFKTVLQTVAGPVMCFLYIHAKLKAEALTLRNGRFPRAREERKKVSVEYYEEEGLSGEDVPKSDATDFHFTKQYQISSGALNSPDFFITHSDHRQIKRKLHDQYKDPVSLPTSFFVREDLVAKVLELEWVIARQNAELAENKLRLYRAGNSSS